MIASLAAAPPADPADASCSSTTRAEPRSATALELPHTVGLVTDLDEHLAERARTSLLAELRRREALLATRGAKSLRELARRDPEAAPPALIIVVDEFATLVREVPAFVDTVRRRRAARPQPRPAPRARHPASARRGQRRDPRQHQPADRDAR